MSDTRTVRIHLEIEYPSGEEDKLFGDSPPPGLEGGDLKSWFIMRLGHSPLERLVYNWLYSLGFSSVWLKYIRADYVWQPLPEPPIYGSVNERSKED